MASVLDLYKSQKNDLLGKAGNIFITSRGLINAPRGAALLAASPTIGGDIVGNLVGGLIKGSANRPSDTIFRSKTFISKPITLLAPTAALLRDAVKKDTPYFVKDTTVQIPTFGLNNSGRSMASTAVAAATQAVNNFGGPAAIRNLRNRLRKVESEDSAYGTKYQRISLDNVRIPATKDIKFSQYAPVYNKENVNGPKGYVGDYVQAKVVERQKTKSLDGKSIYDQINYDVLTTMKSTDNVSKDALDKIIEKNANIKMPLVIIQKFEATETNDYIVLPGTISGLTESITPEWGSFKYVGSPFNVYKFTGVEKTLGFDIKLYYVDNDSKITMKKNLDKLRKLVYPDENISATTYPNSEYSPLTFTGNLFYLTIPGLYYKALAFATTLGITIEDTTPWAVTDDGMDGTNTEPYPTNISVNFGITIIENHKITPDSKNPKYEFDFSSKPK